LARKISMRRRLDTMDMGYVAKVENIREGRTNLPDEASSATSGSPSTVLFSPLMGRSLYPEKV